MSINRINEIGRAKGREVALAYANVSQASFKVRKAIEDGTWNFDGKTTEVAKAAPKPASQRTPLPAMRKLPPRVGKTAKSGGLAAAMQRKKARSAASQELRASMKSKSGK
jgi:hypothetical protein